MRRFFPSPLFILLLAALPLVLASSPSYQPANAMQLPPEPREELSGQGVSPVPDEESVDPLPDEARALADGTDLNEAEARRSLELTPAVHELQAKARELYPHTFAGLWRDNTEGGAVYLAFTAKGDRAAQVLARDFPAPELIRIVNARHSLTALENKAEQLMRDIDALAAAGVHAVSVDVRNNAIRIRTAKNPTNLGQEALSRLSDVDVPVRFTQEPQPGTMQCVPDNCWNFYLRAGLLVAFNRGTRGWFWCTSAFSSHDNNGNIGMLTAGHCMDPETFAYLGTVNNDGSWTPHRIGTVTRRNFGGLGGTDSAFMNLQNHYPWTLPWIWLDYRISGLWPGNGGAVGDPSCQAGITSGPWNCGQIIDTSTTIVYRNWEGRDVTLVDAELNDVCGRPGDSGGPVAVNHLAQGIMSGGDTGPCTAQSYSIFSKAVMVEGVLGVRIDR